MKKLILITIVTMTSLFAKAENTEACNAMIRSLKMEFKAIMLNDGYCDSIQFTGPPGSLGYRQYYQIVRSSAQIVGSYSNELQAAQVVCASGILTGPDALLDDTDPNGLHVGDLTDKLLASANSCN